MPPIRTPSLFLALVLAGSLLHAADVPKRATILCYHIVESPSDTEFSMSREAFRTQMEYLASSGYNVISLTQLFEYVSGQTSSIPDNAVVVTVDDGWRSTYTRIYPEMKRLGLPFTVFVYPTFVGMSDYALTWRQIREMADNGVDIQSHTYSHAYLTKRRHPSFGPKRYSEWLERELAGSREMIEEKTGKPVRFLAYPYGDYDAVVARRALEAGYEAALTANSGAVGRKSDPFRLSRVVIFARTPFAEFRQQVGAAPLTLVAPEPETQKLDPHHPVVSATIRDHERLEPSSVGMAILGAGQIPFSYDERAGRISLVVRENLGPGRRQVVVWGRDRTSGLRVETAWTIIPPTVREDPTPVATQHVERTRASGSHHAGSGSGSAPR